MTIALLTSIHRHQTPPRSCNAAMCAVLCKEAECVHAYGPLRPNMTSSIQPEVHNVAQRHQRRTEPRPQGICIQNFVSIVQLMLGMKCSSLFTPGFLLPNQPDIQDTNIKTLCSFSCIMQPMWHSSVRFVQNSDLVSDTNSEQKMEI